ncbi:MULTISPECIES: hypothetical protein [Brevibacterium]|uniref:Uncharacterized protein n=1 Tax=Brevibacterium salitolerans TaxID=1403566 RepID=A0ABP5I7Z0_9MICO|nr:hypothetical protein [Brevibacterium sp.]
MTHDPTAPADGTAHEEAFDRFLATMPERLSSFVSAGLPASVTVGETEQEFVKDLSPASLPWVEAYAVSRLASPAMASAPANQRLSEDLMRYVGETFIRTLGGAWVLDPEDTEHGMPAVEVRTAAGADSALGTETGPGANADSRKGAAPAEGAPTVTVSLVALLMTALRQRTGEVFVSALATAAGDPPEEALGADAPRSGSEGRCGSEGRGE